MGFLGHPTTWSRHFNLPVDASWRHRAQISTNTQLHEVHLGTGVSPSASLAHSNTRTRRMSDVNSLLLGYTHVTRYRDVLSTFPDTQHTALEYHEDTRGRGEGRRGLGHIPSRPRGPLSSGPHTRLSHGRRASQLTGRGGANSDVTVTSPNTVP